MAANSVPTIPHPSQLNGQTSIPPPTAEDFDSLFGGVLPPRQTVSSYWGTTTYYLVEPSGPTPPDASAPHRRVVLIHGVGTPAIGLLPLANRLAAGPEPTKVLIYDLWGHGLSSTPVAAHVPGLFHQQILQLLSHLGWQRAHFLGYSFGGVIATTFARYHASLVESLALVAPAGLLRRSNQSAWTRFVEAGGWGWGWEAISTRAIYDFLGPGPVKEGWEKRFKDLGADAVPKEAIQVWERENHAGHVATMVSAYRYGGIYDSHDAYETITKAGLATVTLLGETDGFFQPDYMTKELNGLGWKGEIQIVKGVGHGVISEKPKEVKDALLAFWGSL